MKFNKINLGNFIVSEDKIHVSDPCYSYDIWCTETINNVLPGAYNAIIEISDEGDWGERVSRLIISHRDYPEINPTILISDRIEVDSGQAGFFDDDYYKENQGGDFEDKDSFYGKCCELTLSDIQGGIIDNRGAVVRSGYGDGSYELYIGKNEDNKVVSASLVFIEEDDFEEDFQEDDEKVL